MELWAPSKPRSKTSRWSLRLYRAETNHHIALIQIPDPQTLEVNKSDKICGYFCSSHRNYNSLCVSNDIFAGLVSENMDSVDYNRGQGRQRSFISGWFLLLYTS